MTKQEAQVQGIAVQIDQNLQVTECNVTHLGDIAFLPQCRGLLGGSSQLVSG